MNPRQNGGTMGCDTSQLGLVWSSSDFNCHTSQPQLLDPLFGVMYTTPGPVAFADTPSHTSSPPTKATLSESGSFPSPVSSAPSPYFTEPSTPAEPPVKKSHNRRRPAGHIPRPRNAFILFRSHYVAARLIPGKVENDHRHISKIIGEIWNSLSPAERLLWEQKADVEKEKHSRLYPNYRYKPAKLEGVVKRRVKCRGTGVLTSPYSSTPGIGNGSPRELVGSLSLGEGGALHFADSDKGRFIDQEERRKDRTRCARVAELVKQGVVGERLEQEAQRLGLDRESAMAGAPQLGVSKDDPPGKQGHFHTNVDVLRALGELDNDVPAFTNPFAPPITSSSPNAAPQSNDSTNVPSSAATRTTGISNVANSREPSCRSHDSNKSDKDNRGWPHRRASSLPLPPPPPIYREFDAHPHLLVIEPSPTESGLQIASLPHRSSSLSPAPRHRRPVEACTSQSEKSIDKPQPNRQETDIFDHLKYRSPTTSPPEYFYSPNTYPHLQLHYPNSAQASPHATLLSPLYRIDVVRGVQHPQEPIDLSIMYPADESNHHDSALHSTYATPAGEACSPTPATPAAASSDYGLSALKQVDHREPSSALGFIPSPGLAGPYDWHPTYRTAPCYGQSPHYNVNGIGYDEESRHIFPSNTTGTTY